MYIRKLKSQVVCDYGKNEVQTTSGWVRGVQSESTHIFRGVPYAVAQRFGMPRPVPAWDGVREAIVYGFVCPEIFTPIPHDQYTVPHYFGVQSENCQNLNIWTQSLDPSAKKPVMVWLHGGGFFSGSGVEHYAYDGEELSAYADVVVVTITHRLNVLGFLDLSAYGEEYKYSGNAGMADIVAALRWIKQNIAAFGGDPDNVMIFGQSGGGGKVAALLQMPAADGLYHRACLQSGGMRRGGEVTPQLAQALAARVLENLHIAPKDVKQLETVHYDDLATAANAAAQALSHELGQRVGWGPVVDKDYYMGHPFQAGFRQETRHIPILCGTVLGEFMNNYASPKGEGSKNAWTEEYRDQLLAAHFENPAALKKAFLSAYPDKNPADLLFMDAAGRRGCLDFAALRAGCTDAPVFNYIFTLESPFNGGTTAWHNAEIPYAFHNAQYLEPSYIPGVTEQLQNMMASAWANFARTGDPNGGCVPTWNAFSRDATTMIFDKTTRAAIGHDKELLALLPDRQVQLASLMGAKK